jgi:SET domain-containing protein
MMKKIQKQILKKLRHTYCRLKSSKISGVGVFAIKDIPQGANVYYGAQKQRWVKFKMSDLKGLNKEVLTMIDDYMVIEKDGTVFIPEGALNGMNISFFHNHSSKPNIKTIDGGEIFIAARAIKKGEELTADYGTYDWKYAAKKT